MGQVGEGAGEEGMGAAAAAVETVAGEEVQVLEAEGRAKLALKLAERSERVVVVAEGRRAGAVQRLPGACWRCRGQAAESDGARRFDLLPPDATRRR